MANAGHLFIRAHKATPKRLQACEEWPFAALRPRSYVTKSVFLVILCPSLRNDGRSLSRSTWEARGWCRLGQMARHLAGDDGFMINIKTATHPTLVFTANGVCKPPYT